MEIFFQAPAPAPLLGGKAEGTPSALRTAPSISAATDLSRSAFALVETVAEMAGEHQSAIPWVVAQICSARTRAPGFGA